MGLFLLFLAAVGLVTVVLTAKACFRYRNAKDVEYAEEVRAEVSERACSDNVIPFPKPLKQSAVEGISDEIFDRWVKISQMDATKKRADLLLELMHDTIDDVKKKPGSSA